MNAVERLREQRYFVDLPVTLTGEEAHQILLRLDAAEDVVQVARRATEEVWHDALEDALTEAVEAYDERAGEASDG